jgi:hypothetical protein
MFRERSFSDPDFRGLGVHLHGTALPDPVPPGILRCELLEIRTSRVYMLAELGTAFLEASLVSFWETLEYCRTVDFRN